MSAIFMFFARLYIVVAVFFLSAVVFAESSSGVLGAERLRIDFLSVPDWIEIDRIEEIPEKLVLHLVDGNGAVVPITIFNQDGPAYPELVSIFKNKVNGVWVLFAIVKWRYYLSGVNTEGDYYEVHAYEYRKNDDDQIVFAENKIISDFFGSGFDGKQEGKLVHFRFKDAASIRKRLNQIKGW